jgi:hypothetical protein
VQERGLSHPVDEVKGDFRKLLETMAALYNLRTGGADKELQIDQMRVLTPITSLLAAHMRSTRAMWVLFMNTCPMYAAYVSLLLE